MLQVQAVVETCGFIISVIKQLFQQFCAAIKRGVFFYQDVRCSTTGLGDSEVLPYQDLKNKCTSRSPARFLELPTPSQSRHVISVPCAVFTELRDM